MKKAISRGRANPDISILPTGPIPIQRPNSCTKSRPSRTAEFIRAYQNAEYRVGGEKPFTLHIRKRSEDLAQLMSSTGVSCAALITSDNPNSLPRDPKTNREVQESLQARLSERVEYLVDAVGVDPSGNWPG